MEGGAAESVGPVRAFRQGFALYRRGFSVLTAELVILGLAGLLVVTFLMSAHVLPIHTPPTFLAGLWLTVLAFCFGVAQIVLQTGLMRSITKVAEGREGRIGDLLWGARRGEIWLLAIVLQVLGFVLFQLGAFCVMASGMHATGDPRHPIVLLDGPLPPLLLLIVWAVVMVLYGNTGLMAMAMAARYELPAFAALRAALKTFRRGYRRYLALNVIWVGVLVGGLMVAAAVFGVLLAALQPLGATPIVEGLRAVVFLAALCAAFVAALAWFVVSLATFVVASGIIGPANAA